MKNLVIVESPSKSHTIEKYLGSDYKVVASMGHIRELSDTGYFNLGIDINNDFKPTYGVIKGKSKVVKELKDLAKKSDHILLASDPDREGEAISWHLKEVLGLKEQDYDRIVFHEITESAIKEAINNPRKVDMDLFNSQEARGSIDKIIGYLGSSFVKRKVKAKSAGRVQSVALKLICDREKEINEFVPEQYFKIIADFKDFKAELKKYQGKDIEIKSKVEADNILNSLSNAYNIDKVETKEKKRPSDKPLTTSTLTQAGSNKYNYPAKKTMKIAQELYEGIDVGSGRVGLITYMRTDSTRLSDEFIKSAFGYIKSTYGEEYIGYVKKDKKKDNVQDAHEAIRPTSINRTPEEVKKYLTPEQYKIYELIYLRALASLMADARSNSTSVDLENNGYIFRANGSVYTFDGYLKVMKDELEDKVLPDFANYKSGVIVVNKVEATEHFTEPKPRYTEATLIKEMESNGIGRPSTYATVMDTLKKEYTTIKDKKFVPTDLGIITNQKLQEYFSSIINVKYTKTMEDDLDEIANKANTKVGILKPFWDEFKPMFDNAIENSEKVSDEPTGETCPKCGSPMVFRKGKNGKFEACSNYPKCKYIKADELEKTGEKCPNCGSDMVFKKGKYGKFEACSNYPECKYIKKEEKVVVEICDCPNCDGKIIEKKSRKGKVFYGCSNYPACKVALWDKPTGDKCLDCGNLLVIKNDQVICPECNK